MDQQRRDQQHRDAPQRDPAEEEQSKEIQQAFAELKVATKKLNKDLNLRFDRNLGLIVLTIEEEGRERVLRQISTDELLRLSRLLRAKRQQLLDCLV